MIRKYVPGCRIKINTVVSALNKDEIMFDFIYEIAADRWEILRMKPFQYGNFSNLDIQVSDAVYWFSEYSYNEWRRSLTPEQIRKLEEYEKKQKEKREKDLENAFSAMLTMCSYIWKHM